MRDRAIRGAPQDQRASGCIGERAERPTMTRAPRDQAAADHPSDAARDIRELQQMFADGRIQPYIGARFPLADAAKALRHVAERKAVGKVVIDVTA